MPYIYLIKPELTAPGVNSYSSVFNGEFAFFQGTSMATPHLAGSAALLLQQHPDWSPADVKSAPVNTAACVVTDHVNATSDPGVLARGGGRADLPTATSTPLTFAPASASFGLYNGNKAASSTFDVTVRNVAASAQSCAVSITGGPAGLVSASSSSLSLAPDATGTLTLTLNGGKAEKTASGDYAGDVVVTCGSRTLQVPWWERIDRQGKP